MLTLRGNVILAANSNRLVCGFPAATLLLSSPQRARLLGNETSWHEYQQMAIAVVFLLLFLFHLNPLLQERDDWRECKSCPQLVCRILNSKMSHRTVQTRLLPFSSEEDDAPAACSRSLNRWRKSRAPVLPLCSVVEKWPVEPFASRPAPRAPTSISGRAGTQETPFTRHTLMSERFHF